MGDVNDASIYLSSTGLLDSLPDAVIVAGADELILYANNHAASLLACEPADLPGCPLSDFGLTSEPAAATNHEVTGPFETRLITRRNESRHVEVECQKVVGEPLTVLVLRDASRQYRSDLQVSVQRDVLDMIAARARIDEIGDRITRYLEDVLVDTAAAFYLYENPSAEFIPLAGPHRRELLGEDVTSIQLRLQAAHLPDVRESGEPAYLHSGDEETIEAHPRIEACWCVPVMPSSAGTGGAICLFRNRPGMPSGEEARAIDSASDLFRIALDRVHLDREAESQRFNDQLTGLPNRVRLIDRLDQALQRAERSDRQVAVILVNLDRLQMVNDGLGYQAGDELLRKAGERLRNLIRADDLVARFLADDFAVVLEHIDSEEDAINVVLRIQRAFAVPVTVADVDVYATLNIGVALSGKETADAEGLLRQADIARQQARDDSKRQFAIFSSSPDTSSAVSRLELQSRLYRALAANALDLHYQPLVSLRDGSVIGYEALIRWNDDKFGTIPPDQFLPLAEQSGIMSEITAWVLDYAVSQLHVWDQTSPVDLSIGVNVSPAEINDPLLVEQVDAVLKRYRVDPAQLTLEMTEHGLLDITGHGREILQRLRNLGVLIALDDFGTGFSSLAYLEQLPIDCIKIDRTFIHSARGGVSRAPVAAAMVDLARNLGLFSVAEGIEIEEDERIARWLGCDMSQGYYYGRPRPAPKPVDGPD